MWFITRYGQLGACLSLNKAGIYGKTFVHNVTFLNGRFSWPSTSVLDREESVTPIYLKIPIDLPPHRRF